MSDPAPAVGCGHVVTLRQRAASARGHSAVTLAAMAARIAALLGCEFAGAYDPAARYPGRLYFVPDDTLLDIDAARLGIRTADALFGGVVPYPFVATKSLSHPALGPASPVPEGWSHALAGLLGDAVLPGFSAFTAADARCACERILTLGDVRVKPALGIGGSDQSVVSSPEACDAALARIDPDQLRKYGVAIELSLDQPVTYSIGTAELAGLRISYHGTQCETTNHAGEQVYGGSDLEVVRGGFAQLAAREPPPPVRRALLQARRYDDSVQATFPGLFASRRNYDVIRGRDRNGRPRCGVLEQSWRIGGASPAEIAAFEAFHADPALHALRASTREVYSLQPPPPQARVHFRGDDERVGALTKYSEVRLDADPA